MPLTQHSLSPNEQSIVMGEANPPVPILVSCHPCHEDGDD